MLMERVSARIAVPDTDPFPPLSEPDSPVQRYRLGYQLRLAGRALQTVTEARLRPLDLNMAQVTALLFVDRFPEINMARLAALTTVSAQTVHRSVTTLIDRGLLLPVERPDDRKSFGLVLTSDGRGLLAKGEAIMREVQDIANAALDDRERMVLLRLLARYTEALHGK